MTTKTNDSVEITPHHPFRSATARSRYLDHYDERAKNWPVPSETQVVSTAWGETFVRMSGPSDGPPLVLLPGANATSLQWIPNIESLSRRHRTYAVDNVYDFGRSVYTRRLRTAEDFVAWLDELLEALEPGDEIALMGLSYGGWLTAEYALRHPERLSAAVLLAPAGTVSEMSPGFIWRALLAAIPHRIFVRNLVFWFGEDSLRQGEETRQRLEAFVDDAHVGLRSFTFKSLVPPRVLGDEELASLEVPVLFMVGENEKLFASAAAVKRLERVAPDVEIRIVSDAGHDLTLARAETVSRLIEEFLAAVAAKRK